MFVLTFASINAQHSDFDGSNDEMMPTSYSSQIGVESRKYKWNNVLKAVATAIKIALIFVRSDSCVDFNRCAAACDYDIDCQKRCEDLYQCSQQLIASAGGIYKPRRHKPASYECFNFRICADSCFDSCPQSSTNNELCNIDTKCMNKCNKMHKCTKYVSADVGPLKAAEEEIPPPVTSASVPPIIDPSNSCTGYCGTTCYNQCNQRNPLMYRGPYFPFSVPRQDDCFMGCLQSCEETYCKVYY